MVRFSSFQFSRSVVSDSLRPHELQHARPPCPSPTPGVHSDSCPSSQWCHPAISSSVVPFSSCPQALPAIRVFSNESALRMRWPKYWSFSFSIILSKEIPGLIFRMDWLDLLMVRYTEKILCPFFRKNAEPQRLVSAPKVSATGKTLRIKAPPQNLVPFPPFYTETKEPPMTTELGTKCKLWNAVAEDIFASDDRRSYRDKKVRLQQKFLRSVKKGPKSTEASPSDR